MTRHDDPKAPARMGWMFGTVAMAAVLVIGAWLNYRVAVDAVDTLNVGQAELLGSAMRLRWAENEVDSANLQEILEAQTISGLRYLAVVGPGDSILAEAGTRALPLARPTAVGPMGTQVFPVGNRMRAFLPRPPIRSATATGGEPQPSQSEASADPSERYRRQYWNVVEFDPVAAAVLASGRRNLALSALAALLLLSLAIVSWRAWERYDVAQRTMEQQQRLAVLGQMSAVLAHEIRNPLASLKGNAQLVGERLPEGSPDQRRVARVVSEANRLEALTADLLDFARTSPIRLAEVDPLEVTRQVIEDVDGGPFHLESRGVERTWMLDADRIRQALLNVLMNARQASGDGPVTVLVDQSGGELVFEVTDTGEGMPPGAAARIFDPFFTTRTNGTGLGLAVARAAVEKHGGRVDAANGAGGGAVFRITLPKRDAV